MSEINNIANMQLDPSEVFDTYIFFADGSSEKVGCELSVQDAVDRYKQYINSPFAKMGHVKEVRIVDELDNTVAHWEYGKGQIFPLPSV